LLGGKRGEDHPYTIKRFEDLLKEEKYFCLWSQCSHVGKDSKEFLREGSFFLRKNDREKEALGVPYALRLFLFGKAN